MALLRDAFLWYWDSGLLGKAFLPCLALLIWFPISLVGVMVLACQLLRRC